MDYTTHQTQIEVPTPAPRRLERLGRNIYGCPVCEAAGDHRQFPSAEDGSRRCFQCWTHFPPQKPQGEMF